LSSQAEPLESIELKRGTVMIKSFTLAEYLQDLEFLVNIDSGSYTPAGTKKIMEFYLFSQEIYMLLLVYHWGYK